MNIFENLTSCRKSKGYSGKGSLQIAATLLFCGWISSSYSQGMNDHTWLMSEYGGNLIVIDFEKSSQKKIRIDSVIRSITMLFTNAMISDEEGNLKYYTNGCEIEGSDYDLVLNGDNINPGLIHKHNCVLGYNAGETSALFLPGAEEDNYHLIHTSLVYTDNFTNIFSDACRHTFIDGRQNSGKGQVIFKNRALITDTSTTGDLGVVRHKNGADWWIILKSLVKNEYVRFLLRQDSIYGPFVQTNIGDSIHRYDNGNSILLFDPSNGETMVRRSQIHDSISVFDFDRNTGILSHHRRIRFRDSTTVRDGGVCFSPSGRFLYVSTYYDLYQYDLWASDVQGSEEHIGHYDGYKSKGFFPAWLGRMQLGPDCKIYMNCRNSMDALHVIHRPDEKGKACDLRQHDLKLPSTHAGTVPFFPEYRLGHYRVCDSSLVISVQSYPIGSSISIYPNPAKDYTIVRLNNTNERDVWISLYNNTGQCLFKSKYYEPSANNELLLDTRSYPAGIYMIEIRDQNHEVQFRKKLLIE
ncbi:MAG: T9SS type A sorting domain-containing protein [Saprospiraceae bacterium]|nr:T9SS type A sorting domain-containing protein [Saprospiraceae bacterium]